jgi:hypothetical protein
MPAIETYAVSSDISGKRFLAALGAAVGTSAVTGALSYESADWAPLHKPQTAPRERWFANRDARGDRTVLSPDESRIWRFLRFGASDCCVCHGVIGNLKLALPHIW